MLILQGIGPTLIAFRVADEGSQARIAKKGTNTTPVSRLTFRRTGHGTNIENQVAHMGTSIMQSGVAHMEVEQRLQGDSDIRAFPAHVEEPAGEIGHSNNANN